MNKWLKIFLSIVGVLIALYICFLILVPDSEVKEPAMKKPAQEVSESVQADKSKMKEPAKTVPVEPVKEYSLIMRGDEVTILKPTMGAVTVKDYNEMVNLLSVNDMRGITNMVLAGQVLLFENNTKGLVLEAPYGRKRVRILEGVHEYKDCWIMDDYIEK